MAYIGNIPAEAYTNTVKDSFNGDGSTVAFIMSLPSLTNDVRVVVENVVQDPTVAYSCSGTTLTFTSAPVSGTANIYVVHLGAAVMTTIPPSEIADATVFASNVTVQGAFTSLGIDDNATSTAMTLDASGNLLVGKTVSNTTTLGNVVYAGIVSATASGDPAIFANRAQDGSIIELQQNGSTVGSIGTVGGGTYVGTDDTGIFFEPATNQIRPFNTSTANSIDATIDLGRTATRFKDLHLSGGVYLGGTGSANYLDDYERGAFNPTYSWTTPGNSTVNYSARQGFYVKVGDLVYFTCSIRLNTYTKGTASGTPLIGNLPFTFVNTGGYSSGFVNVGLYNHNYTSGHTPVAFVASNSTDIYLATMSSGSVITALSDANAYSFLYASGTYNIA